MAGLSRKVKRDIGKKSGDVVLYTQEQMVDFIRSKRGKLSTRSQCIAMVEKEFGIGHQLAVDTVDSYIIKYEEFTHKTQEQLAMGVLTTLQSQYADLDNMRNEFYANNDKYAATSVSKIQLEIVKTIAKIFIPQQVHVTVDGVDDDTLKRNLIEYYAKGAKQ